MSVFSFFVLRPVIAWVLNIFVLLLGTIGLSQLQYKGQVKNPSKRLSIEAHLSDTSPDMMEKQVTQILEKCIAGVQGLIGYESSTHKGHTTILGFFDTTDLEKSVSSLRDAMAAAQDKLPRQMRQPQLIRGDSQSGEKLMEINVCPRKGPAFNDMKSIQNTAKTIQRRLKSVNGVADCTISYDEPKALLLLDPGRMAANNISIMSVHHSVISHKNVGAGTVHNPNTHTTILLLEERTLENLLKILVPSIDKQSYVPLSEFAQLRISSDSERTISKCNKTKSIELVVIAQDDANPTNISHEVKHIIKQFQESEKNAEIIILTDVGEEIELEIHNLFHDMAITGVIVLVTISLFLGSIGAALVTLVTVPISIVGTFFVMYILNYTINYQTLLALTLAIGLVVDDAIIVVENMYSMMERGLKPVAAAIKGIEEIQYAIIGMTLSLAAVFAPAIIVGTTPAIKQFAVTLSVAVIISGFVALVLSPSMCARLLSVDHAPITYNGQYKLIRDVVNFSGNLIQKAEEQTKKLETWYLKTLSRLMKFKYSITLFAFVVVPAVTSFISNRIPTGQVQEESQDIYISFVSPQGATLEYQDRYADLIVDEFSKQPDLQATWSVVSMSRTPYVAMRVPKYSQRKPRRYKIDDLRKKYEQIVSERVPGIQVHSDDSGRQKTRESLYLTVYGTIDDSELDELGRSLEKTLNSIGIIDGRASIRKQFHHEPAQEIKLNHDAIKHYRVSLSDIADTLTYSAPQGVICGYLNIDDTRAEMTIDVLPLEYNPDSTKTSVAHTPLSDITLYPEIPRSSPTSFMKSLYIQGTNPDTNSPMLIRLDELATIVTKNDVRKALYRQNGQRSVTVGGELKPGVSLAQGFEKAEKAIKPTLKSGVRIEPPREILEARKDAKNTTLTYLAAFVFIFLFLALLYENFRDPIIIIPTITLALSCGYLALYLYGGSLDHMIRNGGLLLTGLIVKHGILIVQMANDQYDQKQNAELAALYSAHRRLRPIAITTIAMVLGFVTLLVDTGQLANTKQQLGILLIPGLTFGTVLTIFVVPCAYAAIKSFGLKDLRSISNSVYQTTQNFVSRFA